MNKVILGLFLWVFIVLLGMNNVSAITYIDSCQTLSAENMTYIMNADIITDDNCFTIDVDNVELDCAGHTIDGNMTGSHYGIYSGHNHNNITVKNCTVKGFQFNIRFTGATDGNYNNLTVSDVVSYNAYSTSSTYALSFTGQIGYFFDNLLLNNIEVYNSTTIATYAANYGLYITAIRNSRIDNIRIHDISGASAAGISYSANTANSSNNIFSNINIENTSYIGMSMTIYNNTDIGHVLENISIKNTVRDFILDMTFSSPNFVFPTDNICNIIMNNVTGSDGKKVLFINSSGTYENIYDSYNSIYLCNADNLTLRNVLLNGENGSYRGLTSYLSDNVIFDNVSIHDFQYGLYMLKNANASLMNSYINCNHIAPSVFYGLRTYIPIYLRVVNSTFTLNKTVIDGSWSGIVVDVKGNYSRVISAYDSMIYINTPEVANGSVAIERCSGVCGGADISFYNVSFTNYFINSSGTSLKVFWNLSTSNPLSALVSIKNSTNEEVASFSDSRDLWLMGFYVNSTNERTNSTPHTIEASKDGYENFYTEITMDDNKEITLNLQPTSNVVYIDSCQALNQDNTIYKLTQDVESDKDCFGVDANNMVFDGQGHTVKFAKVNGGVGFHFFGGMEKGLRGITIKNSKIVSGGATNDSYIGVGIDLGNISDFVVQNNTIIVDNKPGDCIRINVNFFAHPKDNFGSNFLIENNNLTCNGSAIRVEKSDNVNLTGNNIFVVRNEFYSEWPILLSNGHGFLAEGNYIENYGPTPIELGRQTGYIGKGEDIKVINNTIHSRIYVTNATYVLLDRNVIDCTKINDPCIGFFESKNSNISNSEIYGNINIRNLFLDIYSSYNRIWNNTFDTGHVEDQGTENVYCVEGVGNEYINGAYYSGPDPNCGSCECPAYPTEIYIDSCQTLSEENKTYIMNKSISNAVGICLKIGANNITLDCANYEIDGDFTGSDYGIYINQKNDTVIQNCNIKEFAYGIYVSGTATNPDINTSLYNITSYNNGGLSLGKGIMIIYARNVMASNITLYNNSGTSLGYGIHLNSVNNAYIENLVSRDNFVNPKVRTFGMMIAAVYNFTLVDAISYGNFFGLTLSSYGYITLQNVDVHDNYLDFYYIAVSSEQYCDTITFSNVTSNGVPYYFTNETVKIDNWNNISGIALCDADNSTISNLVWENTSGIYTTRSGNLVVSDVLITGKGQLYIRDANNSIFENVSLINATSAGSLGSSYNLTIRNSNFENTAFDTQTTLFVLGGGQYVIDNSRFYSPFSYPTADYSMTFDATENTAVNMSNSYIFGNTTALSIPLRYSTDIWNIYNTTIERESNETKCGNFSYERYGDIATYCYTCTNNGSVNLYNTTIKDYCVNSSILNVYWNLQVANPLSADVKIYNLTNDEVASFSDANKDLWLMEYYVKPLNIRTDSTPHTIEASKEGYENLTTEITMDSNKEITLNLNPVVSNVTYIDSCQTLSSNGTYVLTDNVSSDGTCFTISANDVTLDCAGHTITYAQTSTGNGVDMSGRTGVTVKNCNIVQGNPLIYNAHGISLYSSSNNIITNNNATTSGIFLYSSSNNALTSNTITTTGNYSNGFSLYSSSNNIFTANTITTNGSNALGAHLSSSSNYNILTGNIITTNGSWAYGISLSSSYNNSLAGNSIFTYGNNSIGIDLFTSSSNDITDNSITTAGSAANAIELAPNCSYNNLTGNIIIITTSGSSATTGIVIRENSNYNILTGNAITTNGTWASGIHLYSSSNNALTSNTITTTGNSTAGIYLTSSSNYNTITNNSISTSGYFTLGINLDLSSNNVLTGNKIMTSGSPAVGIGLHLSSNNIITNNNATGGISLSSSSNNIITGNTIATTGNNTGIYLDLSSNNIFTSNTISTTSNYTAGISLSSSSNNTFTANTIITSGSKSNGASLSGSNSNILAGNTITTNVSDANGAFIYSNSNSNQIWNNTFDKGSVIDQGTGNVYCVDGIGNEYINGAYYSGPDPNCGSCECPIAVEIYSCGNLNMPTTYVLKNDINNYASGHCFTISANNVALDCDGHTIDGVLSGNYYGIYINQANDTIIKNCKIKEFFGGISVRGENISFYNMTIYNNGAASTGYGLYANRVSDITVRNIETFNNSRYEIYFYQTNNTLLENANVYGTRSTTTSYPIYYQGASKNHILKNVRVHDNVAGNYSISGMRFYGVTNVSIYNATAFNLDSLNDITYTAVGFEIYLTNNSVIDSCEIYNVSLRGLSVRNSYNNLVKDSYFHAYDGAEYGNQDIRVSVDSGQPLIYCDNTFENVRITGNKTYNFYNYTTTVENADVGAIEMCDADGSVIRNVTLTSPPGSIGHNIRLEYSDNSNISDVTMNGGNLLIYYSQNVNVDDVECYNGSYANKHPGIIANFNNRFNVLFLNSSINVNDFYLHDSPYGISISNFINATLTRARINAASEALRADRMFWTSSGAGYVYGNVYDSILTGGINMTCMFGNCTEPSILNLYNTTYDSYDVNNATSMNVYWKLSANNPLSANVAVKNATGDEIASFSDANRDLWLMEYYVTPVNVRTNSTPHTIEASKDGYEDFSTEITMDRNKEITLILNPLNKPDLTFINGMWVTDENPMANETINITVTVKNAGDGTSEGTVVKFYDNDQLFATRDVNALNATGQGQDDQMISKEYASSEEGLHFIKAVVDSENAINEWDENNNEIIRVVYVGEITEIGNIIVDGYLSPDKGYHGSSIMVYGTATYNTTFGMGTEVKGGDVRITLAGSEWTTHTNSEGYYSRYIQIPMEAPMGINDVDVFITDFTLTGQETLYLNVTNITQEPEEKPDLTIFYSDIYTAPARMVEGDNATLYVKARNVGTQDAYNVSVDIYKGEGVFASDVIPYLPEGGYETVSFGMQNLEAGWFSIMVSLDETNGITELNENNNVMERSFYVYGPDDLDLAVMDIWPSKPPFYPDNLTLYVKVYNDGEAEATDIIMNIYDGYENLGDIFIGSLASQEYKIVNVSWKEPSAGWHAIKAQIADFVNKSNEINWGNNMLTKAIYVYSEADELPDLRVLSDDITFSDDSPRPGDTITIYVNVTNVGNADSTQFLVMVSEDLTEYRETIGEKSIDSLAVGEKKTISVDYSTNLSGSHVIMAEADPYFSVADKNRLNNQATRAIVFEWPCTDEDEDGYGTGEQRTGCTYPEEDCDDADANVNPGATEICNGIDDDCDLQIDENLARECGEGICLGTQICSAGVWDACSTYGMDAGVCAMCDANGIAAYDENQDNDCEATSCPQDGCGVDTCGTNIWGDYPESVNNECSALYTCTQSTCDGTAVCGPDNDTDGWGPQCGDCNDNEASIHPGAEDPWGDGIDQNCDGLVCSMKKDYSPGIGCASTATVVVNNDEELADYMTDYGFDGSQYKNLKIAYDISQMHIDIHSPCKITLKDNIVLTADTICLDGRGGILDDNGYTVNASRVALLSELGNAEFGQGSVVNADELRMEALKTVKIGLNSFAYVGGTMIMNSTGDVSSSDSVIKGGSEVTAGELIIKASRTASVGQNVKINIAGDMNIASTGDYTGSQAEFLSGAKVTVFGNLSLTSGNKALLGLNTNTTVTNNFHMNAQSENKCTISGSATYTAGSTSGNCLS